MNHRTTERRKHPRSRRGFQQVAASDAGGLISHVDNISVSGVLCRTQRPVPSMTKLEIILQLPPPELRTIKAEGIVVRCDPADAASSEFQVAILYTRLDDDDHHAIRRHVDHDLAHPQSAAG
jgi:hypothetical protein